MQFNLSPPRTMKKEKRFNFNSNKELSEYLLNSIGNSLKQAIKVTTEMLLKVEMEGLRKELEEKIETREKLYFNGYYGRDLISPVGKIENIEVPRFRGGNGGMDIQGLELFDSEKQRFFELISHMHHRGVSQEKIRSLCKEYFGKSVSKTKIGKVYAELIEKEEYQINQQVFDDEFIFLVIDGIWEKVHTYRLNGETNKMVTLCVLGIRKDGSRKILGFQLGKQEDEASWSKLLGSVKSRGLKGKNLQLIISDGNEGGLNALEAIYPGRKIQLCLSHKARNVIAKAPWKYRKEIGADFSKIYHSEDMEKAKERCKAFEKRWFVNAERSVNSLKHRFSQYFTFFEFDPLLWKMIRTTNILEREFREVRRRTRVFDNYYQSPKSCEKYHNAIFTYLNNNYPLKNSFTTIFEKLHTK